MNQNHAAAALLGILAAGAAAFVWWASTGPAEMPTADPSTSTSTSVPAVTDQSSSTRPETTDTSTMLPSTMQVASPTAVLIAGEPSADEYGAAGDVAARFTAAYLTRDRDSETWADNWASRAGNLAGPVLQEQLTEEWAQQSSRVDGARSTAQITAVQPLPGTTNTDTDQSLAVTASRTEHVAGIENPLTTTVVLHLHLTTTDTGWIVDAILTQAN